METERPPAIDDYIPKFQEIGILATVEAEILFVHTGAASQELRILSCNDTVPALSILAQCPMVAHGLTLQYFYRLSGALPGASERTRVLTDQITLHGDGDSVPTYPTAGYLKSKISLTAIPVLTWKQHCDLVDAIVQHPKPPPADNVRKFKVTRGASVGAASAESAPVFLDARGNSPTANLNNAVTLMETDPSLVGLVWYDEFLGKLLTGDPAREWKDTDDLDVTLHIQRRCGVDKMSKDSVRDAVLLVAQRNVRNCVTDWLSSLTWDGVERISMCFADHFGVKNTIYTQSASKNFWLSIVARAFVPGCQADNMIVLEGQQGTRKSSALRVIGGEWFAEQHEAATSAKAFAENIQGKLLIEISEMDAFNRSEVTKVKQIITCVNDRFRDSYGRYSRDHLRRCVFAGTTNRDDWNRDETGARRFWPVRCGDIDMDALTLHREQLFAEAVHKFKAGDRWWEMPAGETAEEQADRYEHDAWQDSIIEWIGMREELSVRDILIDCLKFKVGDIGRSDMMRVGAILRHMGWKSFNKRVQGAVLKIWGKP